LKGKAVFDISLQESPQGFLSRPEPFGIASFGSGLFSRKCRSSRRGRARKKGYPKMDNPFSCFG
jgi:hypothetical protein